MNRAEYLDDSEVKSFCEWLHQNSSKLEIILKIKNSTYVPGGLNCSLKGLEQILENYRWRAPGLASGNFAENSQILQKLSTNLQAAVDAGRDRDTLVACEAILAWGGDRNREVGAGAFLRHKIEHGCNLSKFLMGSRQLLLLEHSDLTTLSDDFKIERMNSMLSKIHSLNATDGLPIYDSRVAAAMGALVELWRRDTGRNSTQLPFSLTFPSIPGNNQRNVRRLYPDANFTPGTLPYDKETTAARWTSAMVRLGWISWNLISSDINLFSDRGTLAQRMRCFEAALFIIGYDVNCLTVQTHHNKL